ncbi:MAG: exo-alpha-sialidase [Planctomycetes bacterium]|nr:exo-alpha-sialidase [Planctomycetota bacterium]
MTAPALTAVLALFAAGSAEPLYEAGPIFPPERLHNHGSCIVECPDGSLLACWYRGSGERRADDVAVLGARRRKASEWSAPFVLADNPGFPDCNACMVIDPRGKLWLFWPVILANEWHTALLECKVSSRYTGDGPPLWDEEKAVLLKPGPEFAEEVERGMAELEREGVPGVAAALASGWIARAREKSKDKLFTRLGWMPRPHPVVLDDSRLLVPLYSDGFDFSLMAFTDDWGKTWQVSRPLVGAGSVQPSVVRRKDGTLVAYLRDNGPPPKRMLRSESRDRGMSWTLARDTEVPNPGSGLEVIALREGLWALVNNDTESGRRSLSVWLSPDEGATWPWRRPLEPRPGGDAAESASYPSIIQAADGTLHVTYSRSAEGETIFHARFSVEWVKAAGGREKNL